MKYVFFTTFDLKKKYNQKPCAILYEALCSYIFNLRWARKDRRDEKLTLSKSRTSLELELELSIIVRLVIVYVYVLLECHSFVWTFSRILNLK